MNPPMAETYPAPEGRITDVARYLHNRYFYPAGVATSRDGERAKERKVMSLDTFEGQDIHASCKDAKVAATNRVCVRNETVSELDKKVCICVVCKIQFYDAIGAQHLRGRGEV